MADFEVIQTYLVDIGFEIDEPELKKVDSALKGFFDDLSEMTEGWASAAIKVIGTVVAAYAAAAGSTIAMMKHVSDSEIGFRLYAMQMNMNLGAAKKLKLGLDELGATIAQVRWDPEIREEFKEMWQDQMRMQAALGDNYEKNLHNLERMSFEVKRFFLEMKYLQEGIVSAVEEGLGLGEGGLLAKMQEFNEYLISHQKQIAETISTVLVPVLKDVGNFIEYIASAWIKLVGTFADDEALKKGDVNLKTIEKTINHMIEGAKMVLHYVENVAWVMGKMITFLLTINDLVFSIVRHFKSLFLPQYGALSLFMKAVDYFRMTPEQKKRKAEEDKREEEIDEAKHYNAVEMNKYWVQRGAIQLENLTRPANDQLKLPEPPTLKAVPESLASPEELKETTTPPPAHPAPTHGGQHFIRFGTSGQYQGEEELQGGNVTQPAGTSGAPGATTGEAGPATVIPAKVEPELSPMAMLNKTMVTLTDAVMKLTTAIEPLDTGLSPLAGLGDTLKEWFKKVAGSPKTKAIGESLHEAFGVFSNWTKEHVKKVVAEQASHYDVPLPLAFGVAKQESGFNPNAVSKAGAFGPMQLMPGTATGLGVDRFDPEQNIKGGMKYLAKLHDEFHSWHLALMAYNWGPGHLEEWLKGGQRGPVPKETRDYVQRIEQSINVGGIVIHPVAGQNSEEIAREVVKELHGRATRKTQRNLAHLSGGMYG